MKNKNEIFEKNDLENLLQFIPTCNESYFNDFSKYRNNTDSIGSLPSSTSLSTSSTISDMKNIDDKCVDSAEVNAESTVINDYLSNLNLFNKSDVKWDDIFQTVNCLYVFDNLLSLEMPIKLDVMIEKILFLTLVGMKNDQNIRAESTEVRNESTHKNKIHVNSGVFDADNKHNNAHTSNDAMIHNDLVCEDVHAVCTAMNDNESSINIEDDSNYNVTTENTDGEVFKESTEMVLDIVLNNDNGKNGNEKMIANEGEMDIGSTEVRAVTATDEIELVQVMAKEEKEVEVEEGSSFNLPLLLESQADIDRIHLCLINALSGDLHTLLDMDEKESEIKKDKKSSAVKFPLNQVWTYIFVYLYT